MAEIYPHAHNEATPTESKYTHISPLSNPHILYMHMYIVHVFFKASVVHVPGRRRQSETEGGRKERVSRGRESSALNSSTWIRKKPPHALLLFSFSVFHRMKQQHDAEEMTL